MLVMFIKLLLRLYSASETRGEKLIRQLSGRGAVELSTDEIMRITRS